MDVATLIVLIVLFAGIAFWAFRPKNRRRFRKDAEIPFHSDGGRDDDGRGRD